MPHTVIRKSDLANTEASGCSRRPATPGLFARLGYHRRWLHGFCTRAGENARLARLGGDRKPETVSGAAQLQKADSPLSGRRATARREGTVNAPRRGMKGAYGIHPQTA
jgi:hypothetical protein